MRVSWLVTAAVAGITLRTALLPGAHGDEVVRFAILGDRTGTAVPGAYEQAWKEAGAERPDFAINVGDAVEGNTAAGFRAALLPGQWREVMGIAATARIPKVFWTPGNHDVWSEESAQAFERFTGDRLHYGLDYGPAHLTVLDNSRTEQLTAGELAFLQSDLETHRGRPVKFIFFHRPAWLMQVLLRNGSFPLHQLARKYGVQFVVCGHLHEMLAFSLDGVQYLSMASSGGHLRSPGTYAKGCFFAHALVTVRGSDVQLRIEELHAPFGQGRISSVEDWRPGR